MNLQWPYAVDSTVPRHVHDPNRDLMNPAAKTDWNPGDTCFIYHTSRRTFRLCIVQQRYYENDRTRCSVRTIDDNDPLSFSCSYEELFETKDEIVEAFFGKDPNSGANAAKEEPG